MLPTPPSASSLQTMGLLDDAIREHLDLKRRRGADPAEVQRAEQEALGPVRRNRDPSALADPDGSVAGGSSWGEPDDGAAADLAEEDRPVAYDQTQGADEESAPSVDFADDDDEPFAEEPTGEQEIAEEAALEDATAEFKVEDAPGEGGGEHDEDGDGHGQDEDVLEETPEFLQDTPDHDRLWFEQRPPRDFDFDG